MDYKAIKTECERKLNLLEAKLSSTEPQQEKIDGLLDKALYNLAHIDERYEKADINGKRKIIGSIYPEKLIYDGCIYRTTNMNEAVTTIYKIGELFRGKEKGLNLEKKIKPTDGIRIGFEPKTLSLEG